MAVNSGGEVPESSSNCDQQEVAIMQLEKLRLSTSLDESVGFSTSDESKGEKNEIYHSARSDNTDGSVKSSYDLLCEDDPDDFVTIELPADSTTTDSDAPPLELSGLPQKGPRFLDNLRRKSSSSGLTVITGGRRVKGGVAGGGKGGGGGRGGTEGEGEVKTRLTVHELGDNECVKQEGERRKGQSRKKGTPEAEEGEYQETTEGKLERTIRGEDNHPSPAEDEHASSRRHRANDLISDHQISEERLTAMLSESHNISHHNSQQFISPGKTDDTGKGSKKGEEFEGITAGIGLTTSNTQLPRLPHSPMSTDPSLSSDMLMSLNMGGLGPEMSVRQSLHIGVAPGDLQLDTICLPSNEEMAKEASRARIDSIESDPREFEDEDVESSTWSEHNKHIFVLSLSGKPVYSRYGKEDKLVNLFGIMQALVSFVQDDRDNLRSIVAGRHRFVFACRGPLVFVSVSQSRQSETQLAIQLNYVYYQILSVLTHTQLSQIFEKSPGYDLRYLLQGSEKFVDNILNMIDKDPSFTIGGVRCLAMSVPLRSMITSVLVQCKSKDVLFVVVVANNQVVTYIKPKEHNLVPTDIHLILNLVESSTSFRSAESWTPICLPRFNDTGFLHAHVSYLPNDSPACMLLFSTNKEKFFDLQDCQQRIIEKLDKQGCIEPIKSAIKESDYNIDHLQAPEIRHFLYKSRKTSCVTSPRIPPVYSEQEDQQRLYSLYMFMHDRLHSSSWPTKILYHVGNKEALLGWRTQGFDLYIIFDPLIIKTQAILLGNKLIKWISKEEDKLIITSSHTF